MPIAKIARKLQDGESKVDAKAGVSPSSASSSLVSKGTPSRSNGKTAGAGAGAVGGKSSVLSPSARRGSGF